MNNDPILKRSYFWDRDMHLLVKMLYRQWFVNMVKFSIEVSAIEEENRELPNEALETIRHLLKDEANRKKWKQPLKTKIFPTLEKVPGLSNKT